MINKNQEAMVRLVIRSASAAMSDIHGAVDERGRLMMGERENVARERARLERDVRNGAWVPGGMYYGARVSPDAKAKSAEEMLKEYDLRLRQIDQAIAELDAEIESGAPRRAALSELAKRLTQFLVERGYEVDSLGFLRDKSAVLRASQPVDLVKPREPRPAQPWL